MGAVCATFYHNKGEKGHQRVPADDLEAQLPANAAKETSLGATGSLPLPCADLSSNLVVLRKLLPYLWPEGQYGLRLRVVISILLLVGNNVWSVLTPITYKKAVDDLSSAVPTFPLVWVCAYCALKFLSRASIDIREVVFVHVSQASLKSVSLDIFNHLHALSLRFHLNRQTGGILRAIERGTSSASYILSILLFNILPIFIEVGLTCVVLMSIYEIWFTFITLVTVTAYIAYTIALTEWRNKFRRLMNEKDNEATNKAVDSLINFETVKYFCNERKEAHRFETAIDERVAATVKSTKSLSLLNSGQALIIALGTLLVMLLSGKRVADGDMSVGDFVLVNSYMLQLYTPLNFLGASYRLIKQAMVDLENLFTLLDEPVEVRDALGAPGLKAKTAEIQFKNVSFAYKDSLPILKDVSFTIPSGRTVAVVGPTGSGKSTLARLLFRFYDVNSGEISIDGQNIAQVKQRSLRKAIGVVPQDTVLFNESIRYNLTYARPDATDAEVEAAARLAQIHDFVLGLPEGYETKVGERGLRLSGGEKQRVSIARAILKDPAVMIFDEATSALDTHTEKEIQGALREVSKGRTTLVIAHRLSTIVTADEILVLRKGEVVERGKHEELLQLKGEYAAMWQRQLAEIDCGLLDAKAAVDEAAVASPKDAPSIV